MDDECIHGMSREWCATCTGTDASTNRSSFSHGFFGGETKQDLLAELCDVVGLRREPIGVGSSLPSHVFEAAARQAGVPLGSMPEVAEAIATKAGLNWGANCDSRGTQSGGGSTVTAVGMRVLIDALGKLAR